MFQDGEASAILATSTLKRVATVNDRHFGVSVNGGDCRKQLLVRKIPEGHAKEFVVLLERQAVAFTVQDDFDLLADLVLWSVRQQREVAGIAVVQQIIVDEIPSPALVVPAKQGRVAVALENSVLGADSN